MCIDTTIDYAYFKRFHPEFGNKSLYCDGQAIYGIDHFYIYPSGDRRTFGIAGHKVNGIETAYGVGATGFNATFAYSDGTTLTYNPI